MSGTVSQRGTLDPRAGQGLRSTPFWEVEQERYQAQADVRRLAPPPPHGSKKLLSRTAVWIQELPAGARNVRADRAEGALPSRFSGQDEEYGGNAPGRVAPEQLLPTLKADLPDLISEGSQHSGLGKWEGRGGLG